MYVVHHTRSFDNMKWSIEWYYSSKKHVCDLTTQLLSDGFLDASCTCVYVLTNTEALCVTHTARRLKHLLLKTKTLNRKLICITNFKLNVCMFNLLFTYCFTFNPGLPLLKWCYHVYQNALNPQSIFTLISLLTRNYPVESSITYK